MAARAAKELHEGFYVNLGIGIPTLVANYIPPNMRIVLQSENGMLGIGPFPTDAEVDPELAYSSYFDSAMSFAMIRGGHVDLAILGAMQVSQDGDIANWMIPGKMVKGMGGAMDLVAGVKRVIVLMEHCAKDESKLVKKCNLPLTGSQVVNKIITDLGEFEFRSNGLNLVELAPGVSLEEITAKTEASFTVALQKAAA
jgi:3-oxoacid CoA-transferase subunit B